MVPLLQRAQAERGGGFTPIGGRKARRKQQATVSDWRCMCPEPSFDGPAYEFNGSNAPTLQRVRQDMERDHRRNPRA